MPLATLTSTNRITIPRVAREALQIKPGDQLIIQVLRDKVIVLKKPESYRLAIRGLGKPYPKDYLKKDRQSWR